VDEDANAGRGNWGPIKIECTVELGPGRQVGVEAGAAQEVESEECLGDKSIPEMKREVFVDTAEAGDEVVLEGADGTLGGVAAVDARRGKLEVDVLGTEELLEGLGAFVVKALEEGLEAGGTEAGV
jgi:hypothetical protein